MLESNTTSTVRLGRDSLHTLVDVTKIKLHQMSGDYESIQLRGLVARECSAASSPLRTPAIAHAALKVRA
jgi:hypothetical protein